ncbi:MAG: triose-phosphate isomerase [Gammaproteobacteria bacterium]|nr:MAG: triose-phosphate isomerase [Gammaproteobacteria bacterium]
MRQTIVAGNWKLNGTRDSVKNLINGIKNGLDNNDKACVIISPVAIHMGLILKLLSDFSGIKVGSQNACANDSGAYTGELSCAMLQEYNVEYVIVGHSERRSLFKENDDDVANRFKAVKDSGLIPILCVGETLEERESDQTEVIISRQLDAVIDKFGVDSLQNSVIAYEPVWAIGTGKTATGEQAQEVHNFIRQKIAKLNQVISDKIQILYGGSVNGGNAKELFGKNDIDGGLIGGASLKADEFLKIIKAAN